VSCVDPRQAPRRHLRQPTGWAEQRRRADRAGRTVDKMPPCAGGAGDRLNDDLCFEALRARLDFSSRLWTTKFDQTGHRSSKSSLGDTGPRNSTTSPQWGLSNIEQSVAWRMRSTRLRMEVSQRDQLLWHGGTLLVASDWLQSFTTKRAGNDQVRSRASCGSRDLQCKFCRGR